MSEEEARHARPPLLRHAGERVQVGDELREVAAVPARPPRAAVAAVVDGRDAGPPRGVLLLAPASPARLRPPPPPPAPPRRPPPAPRPPPQRTAPRAAPRTA